MARNIPIPTPTTMSDSYNMYPVLPKHTRDVNDVRYREEVVIAVEHLKLVSNQQKELTLSNNNGNLSGLVQTSQGEVRKLILNDPAYRDAAAILYTGMSFTNGK